MLLSSDSTKIDQHIKDDRSDKMDADKALVIFKRRVGPKLTTKLSAVWDNKTMPSIDKARVSWDYILQFQITNVRATVSKIKADMRALEPATTVTQRQELYNMLCTLQLRLTKIGTQHTQPESELLAIMEEKLVGPNFEILTFHLKQGETDTTPQIRTVADFGQPLARPEEGGALTWDQLGIHLQQLVDGKKKSSSSTLLALSAQSTVDESAFYAHQYPGQHQKYPYSRSAVQPQAYQQQQQPPPWLQHSRPFIPHLQGGTRPNPYAQTLQSHLQQQQGWGHAGARGPPRPTATLTAPVAGAPAGGRGGVLRGSRGAPQAGRFAGRLPQQPARGYPAHGPPPQPYSHAYLTEQEDQEGAYAYAVQQTPEWTDPSLSTSSSSAGEEACAFVTQEEGTGVGYPQPPYYVDSSNTLHHFG
jgi:hypothetical protein